MKNIVLIFFFVIAVSCKSINNQQSDLSTIDPGWQMFNYPRTNMMPGYVYRIKNGDKIPQEVTTLKTKKPFDTSYAVLPDIYSKKNIEGNAFLKLLFLNANDSVLSVKGKKDYEVSMSIGKGFQESLDEITIDSIVKNSKINWRDNNRYYIIQATLATKKIRYKSQRNSKFDSNLVLNLSKVNTLGKVTKDKTDSTTLNQDFNENYRIYYRAIEINSMGSGIGNEKKFTYSKTNVKIED